jgi:DNA modification methylase
MIQVFGSVRSVLRDDGVCWLNLGDSYTGAAASGGVQRLGPNSDLNNQRNGVALRKVGKPKDLLGIPWRVAFALQADGWWLRSAIVWAKPNPMPESCTDRPTSSYEMVFLLSKSATYFYDADAIAEPAETAEHHERYGAASKAYAAKYKTVPGQLPQSNGAMMGCSAGRTRNVRNVWTISTQPYSGAHFATMPPDLAERCIKAGSKPGDTVLDPFGGAGTTGLVADRLGRDAVLIELNHEYAGLATRRITDDCPLFGSVA